MFFNIFYRTAATYSKKGETKEAKASLAEAVSVSNLTIPDFINTQHYKSESDSDSLRMVLENIAA